MSVEIIAEIGVNHNGSLGTAIEMIAAAAEAGATTVKFQLFDPAALATGSAPLADYQARNGVRTAGQVEMLRCLAMSPANMAKLREACREAEIGFLCSPFDLPSLRFLVTEMKVGAIKIPSGEMTNGPLLWEAARSGCRLIFSTGMMDWSEIEEAMGVVVIGRTGCVPSGRKALLASWRDRVGVPENVCLLQCTTDYPCPDDQVNLAVMGRMAEVFGVPVGLSDHTTGTCISVAAVALGARIIEKHFTLDRKMEGPDHAASLEPWEFARLVQEIRRVETAIGSPDKRPGVRESSNAGVARKSLVATRAVGAGELLAAEDVAAKRPAGGRSPMDYWDVIGRACAVPLAPDQLIP